ncbi:MAG: V-type ATP synthase subunit K [Christensenellales bacterium]|jgi:V/A-type H+-transporting ATPase subunit K|nr:V-type ATP synthase subunit K [Christensenellaceae bacterium]
MELQLGQILALIAASLAVIVTGIGSSRGVGMAGETAAGVATENPEVAGKLLVLQLLPATQGIYGFLIAVIVLINTGVLGGQMVSVTIDQGIKYIVGCLPVMIVGWYSAIKQARVSQAGMLMTGKHPDMSGRGVTMAVMVETYAVFGLLISFLIVNSI